MGLNQLSTNDLQVLIKAIRPRDYPTDPVFDGQPLSKWLYDLDERSDETAREAAGKVILHLGTNAIPPMMAMFKIERSELEELLVQQAGVPLGTAMFRRYAVIDGFKILGELAATAIPDLVKLLGDWDRGSYAADALSAIGRESVPSLVASLADPNPIARKNSAHALWKFGEDSEKVVPELVKRLKDDQFEVRASAADSLRLIKKEPAIAVPALIESMSDTNYYVRFHSASALGAYGTAARDAIPILRNALKDSDSGVRNAVEGALSAIDGPKRR